MTRSSKRKPQRTQMPPSLAALRRLVEARTLVRVHRASIEEGHVDGRIVGCSASLVALAILSEGIRPNGFNVLMRTDISTLEAPGPYSDFYRDALKLRNHRLPSLGKLNLTSWRSVVVAAGRRFPLVTVHMERKNPDVCYIGRPVRVDARGASFETISPRARWNREPLKVTWADVTRVDFGGAYEDALALVAAQQHVSATRLGNLRA